ncbi:alternate F1F0 ATPase, F1 subunit alpha [Methylothermus subterraneus]
MQIAEEAAALLRQTLAAYRFELAPLEVGRIVRIERGVVRLEGLPGVQALEVLDFGGGVAAVATDLLPEGIGAVLLDPVQNLPSDGWVRRTGRVVDTPVGEGLLGRVIDPLGRPLDGNGPVRAAQRWPVEREAPAILERAPVEVPLQTGIKVVDALVPIGRGQRELILGDRQTGKTTLAVDTILNQRDQGVICVYCAIGQRAQAVARVIARLAAQGALAYTVVVSATGDCPAGLQFIAPYAATTVGEYFCAQGRDVLVVYDDLSHHADAYRELSLLLRRPPGREAYPGDVFYIHSRLLERACRLKKGGSLTALPIAQTQAQNLAAYIPTNLISITDGQIYLSPILFQRGELPAVDVGKSVSRVGGKAQLPAYREIVGPLKLAYAQYEELEIFARFGTRLDERTRQAIERGRRVRELLKQEEGDRFTPAEQIGVLLALNAGLFDALALEQVPPAERRLREALRQEAAWQRQVAAREPLSEEERRRILALASAALAGR